MIGRRIARFPTRAGIETSRSPRKKARSTRSSSVNRRCGPGSADGPRMPASVDRSRLPASPDRSRKPGSADRSPVPRVLADRSREPASADRSPVPRVAAERPDQPPGGSDLAGRGSSGIVRPYQKSAGTMTTMLPDGRRLGAHLAMGDGMVKAGARAVEIGATAIQIFSDNPTAWDRRTAASPEIPAFRAVLSSHGIAPLAIHGAYLINLAGDDDGFRSQSIGLLSAELATARWFGARIVNIHMGSHRGAGAEAGIDRLVGGLVAALASETEESDAVPGPTITLENSAGGGGG